MITIRYLLFTLFLLLLSSILLTTNSYAILYDCSGPHTNNQDGTCTAEISSVIEDGYVWDFGRENSLTTFGILDFLVSHQFPYVEWNIASLSDSASITSVSYVCDVTLEAVSDFAEIGMIRMSSARPSTTLDDALWTHITDAADDPNNFYATDISFSVGQDQEFSLGANGISDVTSQLPTDWFAIGFGNSCTGICVSLGELTFASSETLTGNPPVLKVVYAASETYQVSGLESSLAVTDIQGNDIEVGSSSGLVGNQVVYLIDVDPNFRIGEFSEVEFTQDIAWNSITGGTDSFASFVHIDNALESFSGPFTMYIPRGATHDSVLVCPGANSLDMVAHGCSGGIGLRNGETEQGITATATDLNGVNIWKLEGVTGTGGLSYDRAMLAYTGTNLVIYIIGFSIVVLSTISVVKILGKFKVQL